MCAGGKDMRKYQCVCWGKNAGERPMCVLGAGCKGKINVYAEGRIQGKDQCVCWGKNAGNKPLCELMAIYKGKDQCVCWGQDTGNKPFL